MQTDPNTFDKEIKDGQNPNPENPNDGTGSEKTDINPIAEVTQPIDYQKKFSESSKEALRILEEKKALEARNKELEEQLKLKDTTIEPNAQTVENLYPGFEYLDEEAKKNLIAYTEGVTRKAREELYKDPAIAFARNNYNENRWEMAFAKVSEQFPELKSSRDEFKSKYFSPVNVPNNIENLLRDIAKVYLFDKAKEIGAKEEREKADRIDLERNTGGERTPVASRTLADWNRMAQENPVQFAKMSKEYHADLASGKLKE